MTLELSTGELANAVENDNKLNAAGAGIFGGFFNANGTDANGFAIGNCALTPVMIYLHFEIFML
jgi:hypothetical protein